MEKETKGKLVDMVATLVAIGYGATTAPAQASKFVKKMNKSLGIDGGGRYLPVDLYEGLCKEMKESKSKYSWEKSEAKAVLIDASEQVEKVESRATALRAELNAFYKVLPKNMPVEALTIGLSGLLTDLEEAYPAPEKDAE